MCCVSVCRGRCGCCYGEYAFEDLAQCAEGHLFCTTCLKRYAQEATFGQGKVGLKCMSSEGCPATFPKSQLKRALPEHLLRKYGRAEAPRGCRV